MGGFIQCLLDPNFLGYFVAQLLPYVLNTLGLSIILFWASRLAFFLNQYNVLAVDLAPLPLPSAESLAIDFREKFLKLANEQMTYMIPAIGFALIIRKLSS